MRTIKFCFVVCGVTSRLSVVNKIHLFVARRCLLIAGDGRRINATTYILLSKCWCYATVRQWPMPKPDVGQKSRFFPQLGGGPYRNIAITLLRLVRKKPERSGYPTVKFFLKICLFVSTEYINVTDRQSDRRTDKWTRARTVRRHSPRLCIMHSIARQFYEWNNIILNDE